MEKDYLKQYRKDPLALSLDVHNLRNGLYHIEGEGNEAGWQEICDLAKVKPLGKLVVNLDMEKLSYKLKLTGTIIADVEMTCIRTLEPLQKHLDIRVDEEIFLTDPREDEKPDEILQGDMFQVGDFINQIIQLGIEPYPVHESTMSIAKGEFCLSDGMDEKVKEEKNPFSVLKDLK